MEDLVKLALLNKMLRDLTTSGLERDLRIIHLASKAHILKVADCIANTSPDTEVTALSLQSNKVPIPVQVQWNLRLGDRVKVKYPLEVFKYIQKETIGWDGKLRQIVGQTGFVQNMFSVYDNTARVFFPAISGVVPLYAGVLEKDEGVENPRASRWKVGDYVRTRNDEIVATLLQKNYGGDIPSQYIGKRGRVIAVTKKGIFITFNERTSFVVNPALLLPSTDGSPLPRETLRNKRGFVVGDKVQVISNYKTLIQNQKQRGEWVSSMSQLFGQLAIVTDLNVDGTVDVKVGTSRSWSINCESLKRPGEMSGTYVNDDTFKPDDIVKFKIPNNVTMMMLGSGIPLTLLDYIKSAGVVHVIDGDCDPVIRFNRVQRIGVHASSFRHVSQTTKSRQTAIREKTDALKKGDQVILDVGPPQFVKDVLKEENIEEEAIIHAMTTPALLLGFADMNNAVIQYNDGRVVKINKKYLTVYDGEYSRCSIA